MIQNYADSIAYLNRQGWGCIRSGVHVKSGYELVFDTSHYVEIYTEDGIRISEGSIETLPDLVEALESNQLQVGQTKEQPR
jgi:hypothetical protein